MSTPQYLGVSNACFSPVSPCLLSSCPAGISAWANGRDVGFGLILLAVAVAFAGGRVAASNRRW